MVKIETLKDMVEALLFASGKSLHVEQLMALTNASKQQINSTLKKLQSSYDDRKGSLMIIEEDNSWKISVREGYLPLVRKIVADTELPKSVIETLAVIAWRSPIVQSKVIQIRTNKAYEHISELERLGFVIKSKEGRTFKLKLTEKFFNYFDVSGNKDIRDMFKNVKGVEDDLEKEQEKKLHPDQQILNDNSSDKLNTSEKKIEQDTEQDNSNVEVLEEIDSVENPDEPKETEVKEVSEIVNEISKEQKEDKIIESEIDVLSDEDIKEFSDKSNDNNNLEKKEVEEENKSFSEKEILNEMEKDDVETFDSDKKE